MFYRFIFLLIIILSSCSKYTLEEEKEGDIPVSIKLNGESSSGNIELQYPVDVYCINQKDLSTISKEFPEGEHLKVNLSEGEYSINVFCGLNNNDYTIESNFEQNQIVKMKDSGSASSPIMSAHSILEVKKATEINLIPAYIVASVEFIFENIPDKVKSITVAVSPVYSSYRIDGKEYSDSSSGSITCHKSGNIWKSDIRFVFPSSSANTKISISMDYGEETKNYSYTYKNSLKCGTPYKFKGRFNSDSSGGDGGDDGEFEMDGDFSIGDWSEEDGGEFDFGDGDIDDGGDGDGGGDGGDEDIETFYVNEIPSANDIFGPLFIWKSENISNSEAIVTVLSPHQWPDQLASETVKTLENYSVDDITGWRVFTESEVHEFFSDFNGGDSDINSILRQNQFEVFYYEDKERYLCENAQKTFNLYGALRIIKAGEKTEYYLRPVKKMRFIIK